MRTGRPPKAAEDRRIKSLHIRLTDAEKQRFLDCAKNHGISIADTLILGLDCIDDCDNKKNEDC